MNTKQTFLAARISERLLRGAIIAVAMTPAAFADDSSGSDNGLIKSLTQPTNKVEAGVGYVSGSDFKFGEYNGLQDEGPYGIGNIDISGGGKYDSNDTTRWHVTGHNLGLENRDISGEYGKQGWFRLHFTYDELLRNRSDTYQTPYNGAGSGNLTLPANWMVPIVPAASGTRTDAKGLSPTVANAPVNTGGALPTAANLATSAAIINADVPAFHNVDLSTKREKYDGGFTYWFNPEWNFNVNIAHEDKNGLKPMGTVTRIQGGDISTIIPDPIDQTTDQYNASLNYTTSKGFLQAAYHGSIFHNNISSVTWQDWADPTLFSTMSSAPSNEFHQINFTGGYNFDRTTKLVLSGSYARSTQNDTYMTNVSWYAPVSSLDALVETTGFSMKFTAKPLQDVSVALGYTYNDRNNETPVRTYLYLDAEEPMPGGAVDANFAAALGPVTNATLAALLAGGSDAININANRPYSKTVHDIDADVEYHITPRNWLRGQYKWQHIDRNCSGSWYTNCADADTSDEHTGRVEWRSHETDTVQTRVSYAYSARTVDYNPDAFLALVPMAGVVPTAATSAGAGVAAGLSAYAIIQSLGSAAYGPGSLLGTGNNTATGIPQALYANNNRISELIGMMRYNMADRDRHDVRSSINWQATEKLALQGGFDYKHDNYPSSMYGLTSGESWAANFDGFYQMSQKFSGDLFYTHEYHQANSSGNNLYGRLAGALVLDPRNNWSTDQRDETDTVGLSLRRSGLFSHKLDVAGNAIYTWTRTNIGVTGGVFDNAGVVYTSAQDLPEVKTNTLSLLFTAQYAVNKKSTIRFMYGFDHLFSKDYIYDGMQYGSLRGVLPTNEQSPIYNVHTVGVSYVYTF